MKKTIAFMITGALVAATTVTAFAAENTQNTARRFITMEETDQTGFTASNTDAERPELPEGMVFMEDERPELPEGMEIAEGERPELPEGAEAGQYVPKLKPENKPEGEDMVPPEFEGVEDIETLGRPEISEDMASPFHGNMNGETAPDGELAPNGEMNPGQFGPGMQMNGEAAPDGEFAPDGQSMPGTQRDMEAAL